MRYLTLLTAVLLVTCSKPAPSGGSPPPTDTATAQAPPDSTVQFKLPPDTLVRGDGARCLVRPAVKYTAVEIGQPYVCQWNK